MTTIIEPIFAGVVVAFFNRYVLGKFDPFAACNAACGKKDEDDCVSFSSTSVTADVGHVHF